MHIAIASKKELMQMELDNGLLLSPMSERLTGYGYVFFIPRPDSLNPVQHSFLEWLVKESSDEEGDDR